MKSLLLPLILFSVFAADLRSEWRVGSARVKITPERPVVMSGYASRIDPYKSVIHDLWAKALVIEDATGKRHAIITTDQSGIYADQTPHIYRGIAERTGIPRERVLLTWSHIHSGPMLSTRMKFYPVVAEKYRSETVKYTKTLQEKLIEVVELAAQSLEAADLSWSEGVVPFIMNRRQRTPSGIRLNPNPSGHVDRSLPCLEVRRKDGSLMAALFQAACHNVTLTAKSYEICGDFAGFAQIHVEKQYPGVMAMFMTGCAGNANPYPRGTLEIAEQHGRTLGEEVCRLIEEKSAPIAGPLTTLVDEARLSLQPRKSIEELESIAATGPSYLQGNAQIMLGELRAGRSLPTHFDAPISVWQFGKDLTLVGISGEVVSGYVLSTQNAIGHQNLWIASYCHDYYGYLPTAQVVRDGGYESRGLSTGLGWFDEKAEGEMVNAIDRLAQQAGRVFE